VLVEICKTNKDLYVFYQLLGSPIEDTFNLLFAQSDPAFSHDVSEEFDYIDMEHRFL